MAPARARQAFISRLLWAQSGEVKQKAEELLAAEKAARISQATRLRFDLLKDKIKLHLGCGDDIKPGWINIDLRPDLKKGGDFYNYDLRLGVPFRDGQCSVIYSSHFFEHLTYTDAVALMRECKRILRSGGIFRAALPDFRGTFNRYLTNDRTLIDAGAPYMSEPPECLCDVVDFSVHQYGQHLSVWDEERTILTLLKAGFTEARVVPYKEGIDPSSEDRRKHSFYVEAL
jgi:SAM-dependent methyltransferase